VTFYDLVAQARTRLEHAGIAPAEAARDADLLARHAAGWDHATWLSRRREQSTEEFDERYDALIARRVAREPVAYIRGVQAFWGREFRVTNAVLIPRPESELLVEEASRYLATRSDAVVLDIGTGSGCIAITLALEHDSARVYASDVSAAALAVARDNAARLGATARVTFLTGPYAAGTPRPVDLIVTNPPYVAARDRPVLPLEVSVHEPAIALFGGDDGFSAIRAILREAAAVLSPAGLVMMEIGYLQADRLQAEVSIIPGLSLDAWRYDLQGIPRVAVVRRVGGSV